MDCRKVKEIEGVNYRIDRHFKEMRDIVHRHSMALIRLNNYIDKAFDEYEKQGIDKR